MLARLLFATVLCCSSAEAFQSAGFLFPYKGMSVSVRTGISRQFSISNVRSVRTRGPRCEQSAESNVQRLPGSRLNRGYSFAAIAWSAACIIRIISPLPWAASPAEKAVSVLAFTIYPLFLFAINALMKAAEKSIQNGGKGKGTLASDTYKRLNLSLFGFVRQLVSPFLCLRPITISLEKTAATLSSLYCPGITASRAAVQRSAHARAPIRLAIAGLELWRRLSSRGRGTAALRYSVPPCRLRSITASSLCHSALAFLHEDRSLPYVFFSLHLSCHSFCSA